MQSNFTADFATDKYMEPTKLIHGPEETRLIDLLKKVQSILADALNSMGGKRHSKPEAEYLSWSAVSVNHSASGFLWLRQSGRIRASKLLVRPTLEATFAGIAAVNHREFLFRKAYSEHCEDRKLFAKSANNKKAADQALQKLKKAFGQHCPGCPIKLETVSVWDTAKMAGLLPVYETSYRLYCQYTHGAMRAVMGHLDEATSTADTSTVIWCVLKMLEHLKVHSPAQVPDISGDIKTLLDLNPDQQS
jgi:Family of unknown function (DUF5677)